MTPAEMKQQFDEMRTCWNEYKQSNDLRLKEIAGRNWQGDPILVDKLSKMDAALDEFGKRCAKIETASTRFGNADGNTMTDAERTAHLNILRKDTANIMARRYGKGSANMPLKDLLTGEQAEARAKEFLARREYKNMTVEVDIEGGYLVRPEVADMIQKTVYESSPMRQLCSSVTIGTDAWEMPYDASQPNYGWVGESQSRSVTTPTTFNLLRIPVHEMYAEPQVSQKLLDDSMFDIEAYHQQKVAERFARVEATAFVAGTGLFQPFGILGYSLVDGTTPLSQSASDQLFNQIEQYISSTTSATIVADDVISVQNRLYEPFQKNASWLMHRLTAGVIRKFKDSQNRYLWSVGDWPGLTNGQPETLLGRPVYFGADVPQVGSSTNCVIYGDFRAGYQIVDRIGIRVLRDPYTTKGFILYYTTKRVGGGVIQFQAFKVLTCKS